MKIPLSMMEEEKAAGLQERGLLSMEEGEAHTMATSYKDAGMDMVLNNAILLQKNRSPWRRPQSRLMMKRSWSLCRLSLTWYTVVSGRMIWDTDTVFRNSLMAPVLKANGSTTDNTSVPSYGQMALNTRETLADRILKVRGHLRLKMRLLLVVGKTVSSRERAREDSLMETGTRALG